MVIFCQCNNCYINTVIHNYLFENKNLFFLYCCITEIINIGKNIEGVEGKSGTIINAN